MLLRLSGPRRRLSFYMIARTVMCLLTASALWAAADPALTQVKAVYLLPMGNGLDQYLASELIRERVFDVVTDPALADAVFTDRIGSAFEQMLSELYPPPPETKPAVTDEKTAEKTAEAKPGTEQSVAASLAERPDVPPRISTFSRGRGNVFLVDRRTKRVLWSDYRRPKNSRPDEINRVADKIVARLEDQLSDLRKPQK